MAAMAPAARLASVDVDPSWYPGQLEVQEDAQPNAVPTVLTKLQKWGDYESIGDPVWPTRFVPTKTPLSKSILVDWQLPTQPRHELTVAGLIQEQQAHGRRLGMLLDLSNHDCLYTEDIPADVAYEHIALVAKELPDQEYVTRVAAAANAFWADHPDEYIAIHCAYGFNRTGFIVCSYLVECCGLTVEQALQSFARSRPPGVKHERFREELRRRYSECNRAHPVTISSRSNSSSSSAGGTGSAGRSRLGSGSADAACVVAGGALASQAPACMCVPGCATCSNGSGTCRCMCCNGAGGCSPAGSIGDNSSIGCSPDLGAAQFERLALITQQGSCGARMGSGLLLDTLPARLALASSAGRSNSTGSMRQAALAGSSFPELQAANHSTSSSVSTCFHDVSAFLTASGMTSRLAASTSAWSTPQGGSPVSTRPPSRLPHAPSLPEEPCEHQFLTDDLLAQHRDRQSQDM